MKNPNNAARSSKPTLASEPNPIVQSQLRRRFDLGGATDSDRTTARPPQMPTLPPPMPMSCVPRRVMNETQIMTLPIDHRMAFVLMHVDGQTDVRALVDITGMVPSEVLAIVERLRALRAIAVT